MIAKSSAESPKSHPHSELPHIHIWYKYRWVCMFATCELLQNRTSSLNPECVPDINVKVVISRHEKSARLGERHAGDTADNVVVWILRQLLISSYVIEFDSGIVRSSAECGALREELNFAHNCKWKKSVTKPKTEEEEQRKRKKEKR